MDNPDEETLTKDIQVKFALEPSYWSDIFTKQLGIEFTQAVNCAGSESYPCLKQFARKPWEKKAL